MVNDVLNVLNAVGKNVSIRSVPMVDNTARVLIVTAPASVYINDGGVTVSNVEGHRFACTSGYEISVWTVTEHRFVRIKRGAVTARTVVDQDSVNTVDDVLRVDHVEDPDSADMIENEVHVKTVIHVPSRGVHLVQYDLVPIVSPMVAANDVNMGIMHHAVQGIQHAASDHPVGRIKKSIRLHPFTTSIQETTMLPPSFPH
jgi:hypothetical protein